MKKKEDILRMLDELEIEYELTEHRAAFTLDEMMEEELPHPEDTAKNLFLRDSKKERYILITVRGDKRADIKKIRAELETKPLRFAPEEDLTRLTGLRKGEVTPFGLLNDEEHIIESYFDREFEGGLAGVHPNDNSATVWLKTEDLMRILEDAGCSTRFIEI